MSNVRRVGVKVENSYTNYEWSYSKQDFEDKLYEMTNALTKDKALIIKIGAEYFYIDYDEEQCYDFRIREIMSRVKFYLSY